jgi:hypothetical protein
MAIRMRKKDKKNYSKTELERANYIYDVVSVTLYDEIVQY